MARVKKSWHELFTGTSGTTGTSVKAIALRACCILPARDASCCKTEVLLDIVVSHMPALLCF